MFGFTGVVWTQVGADLEGLAGSDEHGAALGLSGDGTRLVVGAAVDISEDGARIAVGSPEAPVGDAFPGRVVVYELVGTDWTPVGAAIRGEAANDVLGSRSPSPRTER